jgi:hypothetical protein
VVVTVLVAVVVEVDVCVIVVGVVIVVVRVVVFAPPIATKRLAEISTPAMIIAAAMTR